MNKKLSRSFGFGLIPESRLKTLKKKKKRNEKKKKKKEHSAREVRGKSGGNFKVEKLLSGILK